MKKGDTHFDDVIIELHTKLAVRSHYLLANFSVTSRRVGYCYRFRFRYHYYYAFARNCYPRTTHMKPIHIELFMALVCLITVPYLYISFKKMWGLGDEPEVQDERRRIGRRIAVLLGILATLVFLLPLMLKFFGNQAPVE